MSSGDLHRRVAETVVVSHERRDAAHLADRLSPSASFSRKRSGRPSGSPRAGPRRGRRGSACPTRTNGSARRTGRNEKTTWSPSLSPLWFGRRLADDARALVAARERVDADRDVAGGDVVVGVAQARGHQLDLDLAWTRVVDLEVDDLVLAGCLANDRPARLHGGSPLNGLPPFIAARAWPWEDLRSVDAAPRPRSVRIPRRATGAPDDGTVQRRRLPHGTPGRRGRRRPGGAASSGR